MNKKIAILLLTIVHWSGVQGQFTDNFSDGDFTANPGWGGDERKFLIESEQLRLVAPAETGSAFLVTPSEVIENAVWEFSVKLDFNPSASNLSYVYLTSDQQDLTGTLNGYYVQLGGTDDDVSLFRQSGVTRTKIIDGKNGALNLSTSVTKIRVTRDENGMWQLFSDVGLTNSFLKEGEVFDATFPGSSYSGVYCLYTATRSDKFYFDDFVVTGEPYTPTPPATWKDVIVTEIFANPSGTKGLPPEEFVEVYNRTDEAIQLNGWRLSDASNGGTLSGTIGPKEYVVLTATASVNEFESFGKVIGISGFPSLNNAGDALVLNDHYGNRIDSVKYTDAWYGDAEKKSGGWSLELIDPENPCSEKDNWIASEDLSGGTPGKQNSVFANKPDLTEPVLISVIPHSSSILILTFNEKLKNEFPSLSNFRLTPQIKIAAVRFIDAALTAYEVRLIDPLKKGVSYTLRVSGIRDCNGNRMNEKSFSFGVPETPDSLDVVINEILFNPRPTGADFVELYNPTNKYFNLKDWSITNLGNNSTTTRKTISHSDLLFGPGEYKVITSDPETIISHYPTAIRETLQEAQLPSLPDDEGSVAVLDANNQSLDGFAYTDELHSVFLKDDDGVSLERISTNRPTQDPANWNSASSTVGFATPGYRNSNSSVNPISFQGEVVVRPEVFIPIIGQPSFTEIHYKFIQGGRVANVKILNSQGILIKQIAVNATLGTSGFFRWDGDQENGSKAKLGYYFVWFQVFDDRGEVNTFRKRVVVAAQF